MMRSIPEPARDIAAQMWALLDARSTRDAVYLAPGTPEPAIADKGSLHRVVRPEGTLITTNLAKARMFQRAGEVSDRTMQLLLGYPQSKADVLRGGGIPVVVQAIGPNGGVAYEAAASSKQLQRTVNAARDAAPGATIRLTTLEDALATRAEEYANGS